MLLCPPFRADLFINQQGPGAKPRKPTRRKSGVICIQKDHPAVNAGAKQLLFQRDVSFVMKVVFFYVKGEITMVMAVTDRRMMLKYYYILESFTSSLNSILY